MYKASIFQCMIIVFLIIALNSCEFIHEYANDQNSNEQIDNEGFDLSYPKLAMWGPDSWNQSAHELARYDYIGWGPWENENTLKNLKSMNPDQLHFMYINLTEVRWDDWYNYPVMKQIPAEWFLTQVGSVLAEDINIIQTHIPLVDTMDFYGNPLFEQNDLQRVLAVSHFYHLPRIKMSYQRQGCEVYTVPAVESYPLTQMPFFVLREVAALWVYYLRPLAL